MRTAHAIYKVLRRFVQVTDAAHPSQYDPSIDLDFRSGVEFGNGCSSLILSLLPSTAVRIVEMFGFSSNREEALDMLMRSGGWTKTGRDPAIGEGPGKEGLRRSVCASPFLTSRSGSTAHTYILHRSATWSSSPTTSSSRVSFPSQM